MRITTISSHAFAGFVALAAMLLCFGIGGCAWIVGLDDHHLEQAAPDANADAPADVSTEPATDVLDAPAEDANDDGT